MISIGITGQSGFIGTHLYNYLGLLNNEVTRIPFRDDYFKNESKLQDFVIKCDVIIHLAAINRHDDPHFIYNTNTELVKKLIFAMEKTGSRPHVLFSSSIQEERDNVFGQSKRKGRELLAEWAKKNNALFTGMIIPNVFGPFGMPYYNSVVATFAHQFTHNEIPEIQNDAELKTIYIGELIEIIYSLIRDKHEEEEYKMTHTKVIKVTEIFKLLENYKQSYLNEGIFPELKDPFERNMFNTFVCYISPEKYFPLILNQSRDNRGVFVETIKMHSGGQVSFSTTKPGITRGNHFHTRKAERFAVIKGKALIQLRRIGSDRIMNFELDGSTPACVDMPIWHTHNITNTGDDDLYTIFWISEFYNPSDPDTYFEKV